MLVTLLAYSPLVQARSTLRRESLLLLQAHDWEILEMGIDHKCMLGTFMKQVGL